MKIVKLVKIDNVKKLVEIKKIDNLIVEDYTNDTLVLFDDDDDYKNFEFLKNNQQNNNGFKNLFSVRFINDAFYESNLEQKKNKNLTDEISETRKIFYEYNVKVKYLLSAFDCLHMGWRIKEIYKKELYKIDEAAKKYGLKNSDHYLYWCKRIFNLNKILR